MMIKHAILTAAAMAMGTLSAESGFSYQGRLVDEQGNPRVVEGETIVFTIYDGRSGGNALWSKKQSVSPNTNGTFNVELSGVGTGDQPKPLSEVLSTTDDRYLEISFDAQNGRPAAVVTPRQKILPVPSAIYAQNVSEARGDFTVHGTARFYGDVMFYGSVSQETPDLHFSNGALTASDVTVGGAIKAAGDGSFSNDLSVQGDLTVKGNVTLDPAPDGTTFAAEKTDFKVKSLEIVGGELTVNGLNPGVPVGVISIWSGSVESVPEGWAVCDGSNGTPDLTGRFVVGAGSSFSSAKANDGGSPYAKGATGGVREVKLTVEEMPKHYHEYFGDDQLDTHASRVRDQSGYDARSERSGKSAWFKTKEAGGNSSGGTAAHENLPPYYALFYIMKVK